VSKSKKKIKAVKYRNQLQSVGYFKNKKKPERHKAKIHRASFVDILVNIKGAGK
jgi:hypothetical protein